MEPSALILLLDDGGGMVGEMEGEVKPWEKMYIPLVRITARRSLGEAIMTKVKRRTVAIVEVGRP
jgi:hypothetical protein